MTPHYTARDAEHAQPVGRTPPPPKQYPDVRYCVTCQARISIYNPAETCALHTPPKQHRGRPRK